MKQSRQGSLHFWHFHHLSAADEIRHFVSGREAAPDGPEFTLSYSSTPHTEAVRHNRQQLAAALHIAEEALYIPSQVHKTRIVAVDKTTPKAALADTDALISRERGICLAVLAADCVPILLYDLRKGVVGAVHAGWRGTAAKILEKTLLEMQARWGTRGEDVLAGIGPSVCQQAYEVGPEVVQEVVEAFGPESGLLLPMPNQKAKLDLWKANMLQLQAFGVPPAQIEVAGLCTVTHNQHFFSARRGDSGRFAAGIMRC